MCGIVGYVGPEEAAPILVEGLRRLEYRGYDSAGVAVLGDGGLDIVRCEGKLAGLVTALAAHPTPGHLGIGHTRWATHGPPSEKNAHPHRYRDVAVVHNGIIENHLALRRELESAGHVFVSETDTEIFAHLVADALDESGGDLTEAVRAARARVKGTYALVVMHADYPDEIVVAKNASPLVLGRGEGAWHVASDVPALLPWTREAIFLEEGEIATVRRDGARITASTGPRSRARPRASTGPR